ncbi:MAG: uroporphyrinogen-III synthase [Pseudomonadota bacterium]
MANNASLPSVTLLMTRPRAAAERFVDAMPRHLRAQVTPLFSPLLEIVPVGSSDTVAPHEVAIFTSSNGVAHAPEGGGQTAYCVGSSTADYARSRGWVAEETGRDAADLIVYLTKLPPGAPLVHLRGRHARGDVAGHLGSVGHSVREIVVYDQSLRPLSEAALEALASEQPVIVPLFSPRTARQFANCMTRATSLRVVALSPAVAKASPSADVDFVAARPDAQAMYDAISLAIRSG